MGGKRLDRRRGRVHLPHRVAGVGREGPATGGAERLGDGRGVIRGLRRRAVTVVGTGSRTGSPFTYAGPFTEVVLLGNVAYRVGKTIEFDPETMKVTNAAEANQYLSKSYRSGWEM